MKYKAIFSAGLLAVLSGGLFLPSSQIGINQKSGKLVKAPEIETEEWATTETTSSLDFTVTDWGATEIENQWSPFVFQKDASLVTYIDSSGDLQLFDNWTLTKKTDSGILDFSYNLTIYGLEKNTEYNNVYFNAFFSIPTYEESENFFYALGDFTTDNLSHDNEVFTTFELVGRNWYSGKDASVIFFDLGEPGHKQDGTPFEPEYDIYPGLSYITYQDQNGTILAFENWSFTFPEYYGVDSDYAIRVKELDNLTLYRNVEFHVAFRAHDTGYLGDDIDYHIYGVWKRLYIFTL